MLKARGIVREFRRHGFVAFMPERNRGPREDLLSLSEIFGAVIRHPASDGDGVVKVTPDPDLRRFGDVFTDRAMALHTDGAFMDNPPNVVALQCETAPESGGETHLLDGRSLYEHLRNTFPDRLAALYDDDAMTIARGSDAATRSIFSRRGRYTQVRFRLDDGVDVSFKSTVAPLISRIQDFLRNRSNWLTRSLKPGEILILDNRRVLHGRDAFKGHPVRLVNRIWFDGRSTFDIGYGFEAAARHRNPAVDVVMHAYRS